MKVHVQLIFHIIIIIISEPKIWEVICKVEYKNNSLFRQIPARTDEWMQETKKKTFALLFRFVIDKQTQSSFAC